MKLGTLKLVFRLGAVIDGVLAVEWYAISLGLVDLPVHPSFLVGHGSDFRWAVSVGGLFMLSWSILLWWGSRKPHERLALLLVAGAFLVVATLSDYLVFGDMFTVREAVLGTVIKLPLAAVFILCFLAARTDRGSEGPSRVH